VTSIPQRMQVVRDLCMVCRADGHCSEAERELLCDIATQLEVTTRFVNQSLETDIELD
jgi:tellurite resistance protein